MKIPHMVKSRFRIWPASLAGQLLILLLIALIAAQAITLIMFADERRGALAQLARDSVVSRTAALVRLIENTPTDIHDEILTATSSRALKYWVANEAALEATGKGKGDRRLAAFLVEQTGDAHDVRVDVTRAADKPARRPPDFKGHKHKRSADNHPHKPWTLNNFSPFQKPEEFITLTVSVSLQNGQWLNMATSYPLPRYPLQPLFVSIGLTALGIIAIIGFMVRRLTRPLRELAIAAERFGRGEDVEQLKELGPIEIRSTLRAFNVMQERLTRFVKDRTRLLAAISHDLRTPITSLRIRAEFIDDDENREKIIQTLDEMQKLTETTLAFARDATMHEDMVRLDIGQHIDAIVEDYCDMGKSVSFDMPKSRILAPCRPLALKRALRNLLDNAIRYAQDAEVRLNDGKAHLQIQIMDTGPGIPEERLKDVFEPFVRLEESRSDETGGIGLGLSIARSIIQSHGGSLTLENRKGGGLKATITLPKSSF